MPRGAITEPCIFTIEKTIANKEELGASRKGAKDVLLCVNKKIAERTLIISYEQCVIY